jgi:hypothetical protein
MNMLATIGAALMGIGFFAFVIDFLISMKRGTRAGANPWGAGTLEWSIPSPPPIYNFLDLPTVSSREPLWDDPPEQPVVTGLREDIREVLSTNPMDADPSHREILPGPSIWPFLTALASTFLFVTSIFTPWGFVWGLIPLTITLIGWFWPERRETEIRREQEKWEDAEARA